MTNYHLPSTDRLAPEFNGLADDIANSLTPEKANVFEAGAITVIGLLRESKRDLCYSLLEHGLNTGVPAEAIQASFDGVMGALDDLLDPRLNALRLSVRAAQGITSEPRYEAEPEPEPEVKEDTDSPTIEEIDDLLEELFGSIIGEDAAARIRSQVEGERQYSGV